jgi:dihydrofolate reductase
MGQIVVTEFISLDGVIEDPGGGEGSFEHSGWSFDFNRGDKADQFKDDELMAADVQLLGRITYEGFAAAWPPMRESAGEFGEKMNSMPKYVVSKTLTDEDASWENSTVIRSDVSGAVRKLKQNVEGDILVAGSATLARFLAEHGLVDRINLMMFPIVLGTGKRLFPQGIPRARLELNAVEQVGPDGVLLLELRPKR